MCTLKKRVQPLCLSALLHPYTLKHEKMCLTEFFLFINLCGHNIEATKFQGEVTDWKQSGLEYLQSVCNYPAFGNKMIVEPKKFLQNVLILYVYSFKLL